jgi:DNA-binding protein H-NS
MPLACQVIFKGLLKLFLQSLQSCLQFCKWEKEMLLSDLSVQGVAGTLLATDEMLETITVLKKELQQRARHELADLDRRRFALLDVLGEMPVSCDYEDEEKPPRARGPVNPPKYRNPNNPEQTWSGRGKRPAWIVDHLREPTNQLQGLLIP